MRVRAGLAVAAALSIASAVRAAPIFIDDFDQSAGSVTVKTPVFGSGSQFGGSIGNGVSRTVLIRDASFEVNDLDSVTAQVFTSAGVFDYNSSSGADAKAQIHYVAMHPPTPTYYSSGGSFLIDFNRLDTGGGPTTVTLTLRPGSTNEFVRTVSLTTTGPQVVSIPLTGLPANFQAMDEFNVDIDPPEGGDFRLNSISLVPEPGALGLLGVGALALRRRRAR